MRKHTHCSFKKYKNGRRLHCCNKHIKCIKGKCKAKRKCLFKGKIMITNSSNSCFWKKVTKKL